ncbi:Two-component response regulator-like APRR7 [Abeliophyllum distichum]|uniref:Two-component response regulator-like APRR7 n=1 Tax=Abeliophyllum distichum TaxID=126358 RepID=A0ABD1THW2_9LAMI
MPYLSGMGLLTKIKNHKTCKNIPVIMMPANDSMGIVFKCLSKGAADFLLKPIRKNEVKNLWQIKFRTTTTTIINITTLITLQGQQPLSHNDLSLGNLTAVAANGGPSDKLAQEIEGNANNYGSASKSNGQNGSSGHCERD